MTQTEKAFTKEASGFYRATKPLSPDDIVRKALEITARRFRRGYIWFHERKKNSGLYSWITGTG